MNEHNRYNSFWEAVAGVQQQPNDDNLRVTDETRLLIKKKLITRLRAAADALESGSWPDIMDCSFEDVEGKFAGNGRTMEHVSVTLSYPWGG